MLFVLMYNKHKDGMGRDGTGWDGAQLVSQGGQGDLDQCSRLADAPGRCIGNWLPEGRVRCLLELLHGDHMLCLFKNSQEQKLQLYR